MPVARVPVARVRSLSHGLRTRRRPWSRVTGPLLRRVHKPERVDGGTEAPRQLVVGPGRAGGPQAASVVAAAGSGAADRAGRTPSPLRPARQASDSGAGGTQWRSRSRVAAATNKPGSA